MKRPGASSVKCSTLISHIISIKASLPVKSHSRLVRLSLRYFAMGFISESLQPLNGLSILVYKREDPNKGLTILIFEHQKVTSFNSDLKNYNILPDVIGDVDYWGLPLHCWMLPKDMPDR